MSASAKDFFSQSEQEAIGRAIREAELNTSGEIRVHIENGFTGDVLDRAAYLFSKLGMEKTAHRNGVLIYLAIQNRQFAIIGDSGIHKVVPADFWDSIKSEMAELFRQGKYTDGLVQAITRAGQQLQRHFPHRKDDINELNDEISFGK
jgi:uncharacterized membrane protein